MRDYKLFIQLNKLLNYLVNGRIIQIPQFLLKFYLKLNNLGLYFSKSH